MNDNIKFKKCFYTCFVLLSLRIRWTSWLNGFISGNNVNFKRNLIGYGYERDDGDEGIAGNDVFGDGIVGLSLVGVVKGGVVFVIVPASFNFDGHECGRRFDFNGSNNSKTLPFKYDGDNGSVPISIKFWFSLGEWLDVESNLKEILIINYFFFIWKINEYLPLVFVFSVFVFSVFVFVVWFCSILNVRKKFLSRISCSGGLNSIGLLDNVGAGGGKGNRGGLGKPNIFGGGKRGWVTNVGAKKLFGDGDVDDDEVVGDFWNSLAKLGKDLTGKLRRDIVVDKRGSLVFDDRQSGDVITVFDINKKRKSIQMNDEKNKILEQIKS